MSKNTPRVVSMRAAAAIMAATVVCVPSVMAATFTSEAHEHTVDIFSSSKKTEYCELAQSFSYIYEDHRITTAVTCRQKVTPGDHVRMCGVTHDQIVDPRLEGPVKVTKCSEARLPNR